MAANTIPESELRCVAHAALIKLQVNEHKGAYPRDPGRLFFYLLREVAELCEAIGKSVDSDEAHSDSAHDHVLEEAADVVAMCAMIVGACGADRALVEIDSVCKPKWAEKANAKRAIAEAGNDLARKIAQAQEAMRLVRDAATKVL